MFEYRDLPLLVVFAAVVRNGSFTAAAAELGVAKSVISDNIRQLESRCGVRLLERTTRRVQLTQVGEQVLASTERLLAAADEVRAATEAQHSAPSGTLRIAATLDLGARFVAPTVASLCTAYPELRTELFFDDKEIDPVALSVDAAVRLGVPKESTFIARKLAEDEEVIAAAPALAERWTSAARPSDLASAPWVAHASLVRTVPQRFTGPRGAEDEFQLTTIRALASNADGMRALCRGGVGFVTMPRHLLAEDLSAGRVVRVLAPWFRRMVGIYLLLPSRKHPPRRVTLFAEAITKAIRADKVLGA